MTASPEERAARIVAEYAERAGIDPGNPHLAALRHAIANYGRDAVSEFVARNAQKVQEGRCAPH